VSLLLTIPSVAGVCYHSLTSFFNIQPEDDEIAKAFWAAVPEHGDHMSILEFEHNFWGGVDPNQTENIGVMNLTSAGPKTMEMVCGQHYTSTLNDEGLIFERLVHVGPQTPDKQVCVSKR
jgi:hypothetical protein